jgi:predicted RNA-binding Zn-ribbon protein involved in translation (DUF1610 family)
MTVTPLARTLDQELVALLRGVSLECPVCGEFVMRFDHALACPECRSILADGTELPEIRLPGSAVGASGAARLLGRAPATLDVQAG